MRVTIPAAPRGSPGVHSRPKHVSAAGALVLRLGCRSSVGVRGLSHTRHLLQGRQPYGAQLSAPKGDRSGGGTSLPRHIVALLSRALRPRFGAPRGHPRPNVSFTLSATANPRRSTCDGAAAAALETTRPWRVLHCVTARREASFAWVSQAPSAALHARRRGNGPSPEQRKDQ